MQIKNQINENIQKLQKTQLMILNDIHNFCIENDIKYYIIAGTLLGAIKYGGFIPWDDDLDIAIFRDDFIKFKKLFQQKYSSKYFVQDNHSDKNYTRFIMKVRLNETKQVEKSISHINMHHGIYIDIFPLDFVKKDGGFKMKLRGAIIRLAFLIANIKIRKKTNDRLSKKIIKSILSLFAVFIPFSLLRYTMDKTCSLENNKNASFITSFLRRDGWRKETFEKSIYGAGKLIEFEGGKFFGPDKPEIMLRKIYGDYEIEPPLDRQVSGHNIVELDFGPYKKKQETRLDN